MIVFFCKSCKQRYNVKPELAGRSFKCKKCGEPISVPVPPPPPKPPSIPQAPVVPSTARASSQGRLPTKRPTRPVSSGIQRPVARSNASAGSLRPTKVVKNAPARRRTSQRHGTTSGISPAQQAPLRQQQPGRPIQAARRKKRSKGLVIALSCGGGALVLVAVIILVVVMGDSTSNPAVDRNGQPSGMTQAERDAAERERVRKQLEARFDTVERWLDAEVNHDNYSGLWRTYQELKSIEEVPQQMAQRRLDLFARIAGYMKAKKDPQPDQIPAALQREIAEAFMLDGFEEAARSLALSVITNEAYKRSVHSIQVVDGIERRVTEEDPDYVWLEKVAGYAKYDVPDVIGENQYISGFEEYKAYQRKRQDFQLENGMDRAWPMNLVEEMKEAEKPVLDLIASIESAHEHDGYARYAAKAFSGFRTRWASEFTGKWTYHYAKPFVFYLELSDGERDNKRSAEQITQSLETKSRILRDLASFFEENFRKPWKLERKYPKNLEADEKEQWPLEIVVLMDEERYQAYGDSTMGGLPEGVRAHYSPKYRQVITWDDPNSLTDMRSQWFDRSVIIHEAWHFISSIYMDEDISYFDQESSQKITLPSYSSLLVQEGLTDMVAGFETDGEHYTFRRQNHLRLEGLQSIITDFTEIWKEQSSLVVAAQEEAAAQGAVFDYPFELYQEGKWASALDFRGIVLPNQYGFIQFACPMSLERWGLHGSRYAALPQLVPSWGQGMYYSSACLAAYFMHTYENGKYRDKFYEWCRQDYTREINKDLRDFTSDLIAGYADENDLKRLPGFVSFCDIFGFEDGWDDPKWHELTDEFFAWVMQLKAENVGKGYETVDVPEGEEAAGLDEDGDRDGMPDAKPFGFAPSQPVNNDPVGEELFYAACGKAIVRPTYTRLTRRPSPQVTS